MLFQYFKVYIYYPVSEDFYYPLITTHVNWQAGYSFCEQNLKQVARLNRTVEVQPKCRLLQGRCVLSPAVLNKR